MPQWPCIARVNTDIFLNQIANDKTLEVGGEAESLGGTHSHTALAQLF